jgi:type IV secretory pathway protease TraF
MKTIGLPLERLRDIPENTPVVMVNLLRYRREVAYAEAPDGVTTGRDAYYRGYIPTFLKIVGALGGAAAEVRPLYVGAVVTGLVVAGDERWDDAAIVSYPNIATFRAIVESEVYRREAQPHRLAALEDWRLLATVPDSSMAGAVTP